MKISRIFAGALAFVSSMVFGACRSPEEPVSIATAVESVSVVEPTPPDWRKGLRVSLRLADADGSNLELLPCTVGLERFDGQRWNYVYGEMCALLPGVGLDASPIIDGMLNYRFMAFDFPSGQYRLAAAVRRVGRIESVTVRAQFELAAVQTR